MAPGLHPLVRRRPPGPRGDRPARPAALAPGQALPAPLGRPGSPGLPPPLQLHRPPPAVVDRLRALSPPPPPRPLFCFSTASSPHLPSLPPTSHLPAHPPR